jgi:hypothetical protein
LPAVEAIPPRKRVDDAFLDDAIGEHSLVATRPTLPRAGHQRERPLPTPATAPEVDRVGVHRAPAAIRKEFVASQAQHDAHALAEAERVVVPAIADQPIEFAGGRETRTVDPLNDE